MLTEITGIHRVRMLYLQLLYRCNFRGSSSLTGEGGRIVTVGDGWWIFGGCGM